MEVKAISTAARVEVDGVLCRVWMAETIGDPAGIPVTMYVREVSFPAGTPESALEGLEFVPDPQLGTVQQRFAGLTQLAQALFPAHPFAVIVCSEEHTGLFSAHSFAEPDKMFAELAREFRSDEADRSDACSSPAATNSPVATAGSYVALCQAFGAMIDEHRQSRATAIVALLHCAVVLMAEAKACSMGAAGQAVAALLAEKFAQASPVHAEFPAAAQDLIDWEQQQRLQDWCAGPFRAALQDDQRVQEALALFAAGVQTFGHPPVEAFRLGVAQFVLQLIHGPDWKTQVSE